MVGNSITKGISGLIPPVAALHKLVSSNRKQWNGV